MPFPASLAAVEAFYEALNRPGDAALLSQALAPEWVVHPPLPGAGPDLARYAVAVQPVFQALPDFHIETEHWLQQGDVVAVRGRVRATHQGPLLGVPATGRAVGYTTQDMHRLEDGRIVESWHLEDWLTVLFQIGGLPLPGTAG